MKKGTGYHGCCRKEEVGGFPFGLEVSVTRRYLLVLVLTVHACGENLWSDLNLCRHLVIAGPLQLSLCRPCSLYLSIYLLQKAILSTTSHKHQIFIIIIVFKCKLCSLYLEFRFITFHNLVSEKLKKRRTAWQIQSNKVRKNFRLLKCLFTKIGIN